MHLDGHKGTLGWLMNHQQKRQSNVEIVRVQQGREWAMLTTKKVTVGAQLTWDYGLRGDTSLESWSNSLMPNVTVSLPFLAWDGSLLKRLRKSPGNTTSECQPQGAFSLFARCCFDLLPWIGVLCSFSF